MQVCQGGHPCSLLDLAPGCVVPSCVFYSSIAMLFWLTRRRNSPSSEAAMSEALDLMPCRDMEGYGTCTYRLKPGVKTMACDVAMETWQAA